MSRKIGGLQAKVNRMVSHSRGLTNAAIYAAMKSSAHAGGSDTPYAPYDFTIGGFRVNIGGREIDI